MISSAFPNSSNIRTNEDTNVLAALKKILSGGRHTHAKPQGDQIDAATSLLDLELPGNRLEALKGNRKGQYSVRINDQWRICFEWAKGTKGPSNVEIVDYH